MRLLVSLALLLLATGCPKSTPAPALAEPPLSLTLPRYPDLTHFDLASERGHVVMLDIWATWCEPCRESLPQYQATLAKYEARGFRLYAVNVDSSSALVTEIPRFITETKLAVPVLLDTDAAQAEANLKVKVMPTALLVDKHGRVRQVHEGFEGKKSLDAVAAQVESLLAEP